MEIMVATSNAFHLGVRVSYLSIHIMVILQYSLILTNFVQSLLKSALLYVKCIE